MKNYSKTHEKSSREFHAAKFKFVDYLDKFKLLQRKNKVVRIVIKGVYPG